MRKIKNLTFSFLFAFLTVFSVGTVSEMVVPIQEVSAEEANTVFGGQEVNSNVAATDTEAKKIIESLRSAANILAGLTLGVSVIMIILGGLKYIMANGDPKQAESGKMILIYSGIGIVIAMSAFVIARLFSSFSFATTTT